MKITVIIITLLLYHLLFILEYCMTMINITIVIVIIIVIIVITILNVRGSHIILRSLSLLLLSSLLFWTFEGVIFYPRSVDKLLRTGSGTTTCLRPFIRRTAHFDTTLRSLLRALLEILWTSWAEPFEHFINDISSLSLVGFHFFPHFPLYFPFINFNHINFFQWHFGHALVRVWHEQCKSGSTCIEKISVLAKNLLSERIFHVFGAPLYRFHITTLGWFKPIR